MPFFQLDDIPQRDILPGCHARFIHSENMTFAYWNLDEGAVLPDHAHPHEQVCTMIEGELELKVGEESRIIRRGDVVVIPGDTIHMARAIKPCFVLDVFYPVRDDYR
ncbi:MAG: cupin domain-containing protein [Armatimonadota bacterium]